MELIMNVNFHKDCITYNDYKVLYNVKKNVITSKLYIFVVSYIYFSLSPSIIQQY
jgi:hypothetical protein